MQTSRTRLAGATAIALAFLLTSAAAHAGNGKAALSKLPKSTAMVFAINVDRARTSPLFKDALAAVNKNPDMAKGMAMLKAQGNFDVARDLHTVIVGLADDFQKSEKAVVLIEGKFSAKKLVAFAKQAGGAVKELAHAGVKYYLIDDAEMAFLGKYMVMAPKGNMPAVIDVHKGKAPNVKKNRGFMRLLKSADTRKDFWGVAVLPKDVNSMIKMQTGGHGLDGVTASVDVRKGLVTKLRLAASSLAAAKSLSALMNTYLTQAKNDPNVKAMGMGSVLSNVKVTQSKANIDVLIKMTAAELTAIKNMLGAFM